jgi:hypothetical protein
MAAFNSNRYRNWYGICNKNTKEAVLLTTIQTLLGILIPLAIAGIIIYLLLKAFNGKEHDTSTAVLVAGAA